LARFACGSKVLYHLFFQIFGRRPKIWKNKESTALNVGSVAFR
jgi:hypothetical protein